MVAGRVLFGIGGGSLEVCQGEIIDRSETWPAKQPIYLEPLPLPSVPCR